MTGLSDETKNRLKNELSAFMARSVREGFNADGIYDFVDYRSNAELDHIILMCGQIVVESYAPSVPALTPEILVFFRNLSPMVGYIALEVKENS